MMSTNKSFQGSIPYSLSVAPPPMATELLMSKIGRLLQQENFNSASLEDLNKFLLSAEAQKMLSEMETDEPKEKARELVMLAWESQKPRRYELAKQALSMNPHCSDAYLILAETTNTWRKQKRYFEQAVVASENLIYEYQELAKQDESPNSLYGIVEVRPWFRAKLAMGRILSDGGLLDEARAIFLEILKWDPEDHLGVRYDLIRVLHEQDDLDELSALFVQFEDDTGTFLEYERLWLAIRRQRVDAEEYLQRAKWANPHFLAIVMEPYENVDTEFMTIGSREEAALYFNFSASWWGQDINILKWVIDHWSNQSASS